MDLLTVESNAIESEYESMSLEVRRAFADLEALRSNSQTTGLQVTRAARRHKQLLKKRDAVSRLLEHHPADSTALEI